MVSVKNLAICDEYHELEIDFFLLFRTSVLKIKSKRSKNCERRQTNCKPRSVWHTQTDLKDSCDDMRRIYLNWFLCFYNQLKAANRSNRVLLKNTSNTISIEKHIKHIEHALHELMFYVRKYFQQSSCHPITTLCLMSKKQFTLVFAAIFVFLWTFTYNNNNFCPPLMTLGNFRIIAHSV